MTMITSTLYPLLAIVLACGTIGLGFYIILSNKQKPKSDSRKAELSGSYLEAISSMSEDLKSVMNLLNQMDKRLEHVGNRLDKIDSQLSQITVSAPDHGGKLFAYFDASGQLRRTA